jgi:hypothetical protein
VRPGRSSDQRHPIRIVNDAPVWIGREGDLLLVCTEAGSLKGKNTLREPRLSISMVDFVDPYSEVQMRGRVVERRPDPKLRHFDPMSMKYIGNHGLTATKNRRSFWSLRSRRHVIRSSPSSTRRPGWLRRNHAGSLPFLELCAPDVTLRHYYCGTVAQERPSTPGVRSIVGCIFQERRSSTAILPAPVPLT